MSIIVKILKEHVAHKRRVEIPVDRHLHVNAAYYQDLSNLHEIIFRGHKFSGHYYLLGRYY